MVEATDTEPPARDARRSAKLRRVFYRLDPIEGESLTGYVARVCAENLFERMHVVMREAGWPHRRWPLLATTFPENLPDLAAVLGTRTIELQRRSNMRVGSDGTRLLWFGSTIHRNDLEVRYRRFSPAALATSNHHRAIWQLRFLPFCTESWEFLQDACGSCGATQGWCLTPGLSRCEACNSNLSSQAGDLVPEHQRARLQLFANLASPSPSRRATALASLHPTLVYQSPADIVELMLRLVRLVAPARCERIKGRVRIADPVAFCDALHDAIALLQDWPDAAASLISERLARRVGRALDGNYGASVAFLKLRHDKHTPVPVRRFIEQMAAKLGDHASWHAVPPNAPAIGLKDTKRALSLRESEVVQFRFDLVLATRATIIAGNLVPACARDEIADLARGIADRLSFEKVAAELGTSYHGVEQLVALGCLPLLAHQFFSARYGVPQTTRTGLAELERRLLAVNARVIRPVALRRACRAIGNRPKPWGAIITALLDRKLPSCCLPGSAPLSDRLLVSENDLPVIAATSFEPSAHHFPFADAMSKRDAGEALNLPPREASLLLTHVTARGGGQRHRLVPVASVRALCSDYASTVELATRIGATPLQVRKLLLAAGVPAQEDGVWPRMEAEIALGDSLRF